MAQKHFDVRSVVVRILDPARAEFFSRAASNVVCPTSSAIETLTKRCAPSEGALQLAMYLLIAGGGKVGSNLARTLIRAGHEVTLIEQRPCAFDMLEAEFEHQVHKGDATELFVLERAGHQAAARRRRRGHRRRRGQRHHLPARPRQLRRRDDDRARERPAQPAVLRPARHLADGVGDRVDHGPDRARGARARADPPARAEQGEPRDRRDHRRPGAACAGKTISKVALPEGSRVISIVRDGKAEAPDDIDAARAGRLGARDPRARQGRRVAPRPRPRLAAGRRRPVYSGSCGGSLTALVALATGVVGAIGIVSALHPRARRPSGSSRILPQGWP